jgi:hypothetical protein
MNSAIRKNKKKAQIGETLTWIVATLIIIVILFVFIFASVLMSKVKIIKMGDVETDLKESNLLEKKTSFAHQIVNHKNEEIIIKILKENEA